MDNDDKIQESLRDIIYVVAKSTGVIWLVKHIPFLELKDWIQERESKNV